MPGLSSIGASPIQTISSSGSRPPSLAAGRNQPEANSIIDVGDLPNGIIDVGDLPDGIIDIGDLPDGIIDIGDLPDGIIDVGDLPDGLRAGKFDQFA